MKRKRDLDISDCPGNAQYLCEPCLRGSGWQRIYTHTPYLGDGTSQGRLCGNCKRPECVTRIKKVRSREGSSGPTPPGTYKDENTRDFISELTNWDPMHGDLH